MLSDEDTKALVMGAMAFEAWLHEGGWDAPPQLVRIHRSTPEEVADGEPELWFEDTVIDGETVFDALDRVTLEDEAVALLLSLECWAFPPDLPEDERVGRATDHPDRVDVRNVTVADADGHVFVVQRYRGGEPAVRGEEPDEIVSALKAGVSR